MKLVEIIKKDHIESRKEGNKTKLSALTMLLSRIDRERVKYGAKVVEDMNDDQVLKVVSAEVKSLREELSYIKDSEKIETLTYQINILEKYVPKEMSDESVEILVNKAVEKLNGKVSMKDIMSTVKEIYKEEGIGETLPMKKVSIIAKNFI